MRGRWLLVFLVAISCGGKKSEPARPTTDVSGLVWKVELSGRPGQLDEIRRDAIVAALHTANTDVVCLSSVWGNGEKARLASAVAATYPYSVVLDTKLDTQPTEPANQTGESPPLPTTPPCSSAKGLAALDDVKKCLVEHCSTVKGSDTGYVTNPDCFIGNCTAEGLALSNSDAVCFGCGRIALEERTIGDASNWCTTEVNARWSASGRHGAMLLSRLPIESSELYVLPSTFRKRGVLRARLRTKLGGTFDAYCAQLGFALEGGLTDPYIGPYGLGEKGGEGWLNEQMFQAERLAKLVRDKSGDGQALVLVDAQASRAFASGGKEIVADDLGAKTVDLLRTLFTEATPAGQLPSCTVCPEAGGYYTSDEPPLRPLHIFLRGIGRERVRASSVVFTERTAKLMDGKSVAPTWSYSLRSIVAVE